MANIELNEWIGTEDATEIFDAFIFMMDTEERNWRNEYSSTYKTQLIVAYAYKCGRLDERGKND